MNFNSNENCKHQWEEGVCLLCGAEYSKRVKNTSILARFRWFFVCVKYRLITGFSLKSLGFLPIHIRSKEFRRMVLNVASLRIARHQADRREASVSHAPFLFFMALASFVGFFYTSAVIYALIQPSPCQAQTVTSKVTGVSDGKGRCSTLDGKKICDGSTNYDGSPIKKRPAIIAKSDSEISITFHDCRENDKKHVSCEMIDDDSKSHWVYIPGLNLPIAAH